MKRTYQENQRRQAGIARGEEEPVRPNARDGRQVLARDGALTTPEKKLAARAEETLATAKRARGPGQPPCQHPALDDRPGHQMRARCADCGKPCHRPYPGDKWRVNGT